MIQQQASTTRSYRSNRCDAVVLALISLFKDSFNCDNCSSAFRLITVGRCSGKCSVDISCLDQYSLGWRQRLSICVDECAPIVAPSSVKQFDPLRHGVVISETRSINSPPTASGAAWRTERGFNERRTRNDIAQDVTRVPLQHRRPTYRTILRTNWWAIWFLERSATRAPRVCKDSPSEQTGDEIHGKMEMDATVD